MNYNNPVEHRAEIERLRQANEDDEIANLERTERGPISETDWQVPQAPPKAKASVRASYRLDDPALRRVVEHIATQKFTEQFAGLMKAIGEVVTIERERHRKQLRSLRMELRQLKRDLRAQNALRLVA